jgi:hypothetical protein
MRKTVRLSGDRFALRADVGGDVREQDQGTPSPGPPDGNIAPLNVFAWT